MGGPSEVSGHCPPQASSSASADFLQMERTSPPLPHGKPKKQERGVGSREGLGLGGRTYEYMGQARRKWL